MGIVIDWADRVARCYFTPIPESPISLRRVAVAGTGCNETKSAGYAMVTLKIGEDIKILPGVRFQSLSTTYHAMRGISVPGGIQGSDTTVTQSHGYFLPMVRARYSPLDWLTIHAAYTNTLNYPDYSAITPR